MTPQGRMQLFAFFMLLLATVALAYYFAT